MTSTKGVPLTIVRSTLSLRNPPLQQQRQQQGARLGALHRLLNNLEGSLSATYKKNAEANDKACDLNKTMQALDALAEEYGVFQASMKKVMTEHEESEELNA